MHSVSSPEAAEMTKLLENTFRAVNIALANEFSDAAEELSVDIIEVIRAAAPNRTASCRSIPVPVLGGHCIPCDPHYLLWQLRARRFDSPLMRTAMTAIATRPRDVVIQAKQMLGEAGRQTRDARVLVLGVTYKPGVADLRESPAIEIIDQLALAGATVAFADPLIEFIDTPSTGTLMRERHPSGAKWDLVLVHTLHAGVDYGWLAKQPVVLDMTFRVADIVGHRTN